MDIEPTRVSLNQYRQHNGKWYEIDKDVCNVAADLKDIDPHLRLRASEQGHYVVYWLYDNGDEDLITTSVDLDQRIVNLMKKLGSSDYDYVTELDRLDSQAKKQADYEFSQKIGEIGERLVHALRKDLGVYKDSARNKRVWGKT